MFRTILVCSVYLVSAVSSLFADELRTLGGKNVTGTLTAIKDGELVLKETGGGTVVTPLAQVLALDIRQPKGIPIGTKYVAVKLVDDSVLHCESVRFQGNEAEIKLLSGASFKLPVNFIVWLVHEAQNAPLRKKFDEHLAQKSRRDRIVILRDMDLNALEGTFGDIDPKGTTIQFRRDGAEAINILFERLHGLIFYRSDVPSETPLCRVFDVDGNTLIATKVSFEEPDRFELTTTFGAKIALKRDTLAKLDFNLGKLTYLSDIEPAKVVERSGIGLVTRYRKDTNLDGEPIILEKQHAKGLSLHAHTELDYNLAGKYKEFKALVGVDVRTGSDSQALVTIYCDGEKRFSEIVSVKAPRNIALNVKEVNTLRIVVSARNFLDLHDHATLADARVSQ